MKEQKEKLPPVSAAEKCMFFEKVFRELKIAPINNQYVCEVKWNGVTWLRKSVSRRFYTLDCSCYQLGKYAIIWKARSSDVLFLMDSDVPYEMFSIAGYDFFIRKKYDDNYVIEHYAWDQATNTYDKITYEKNFIPDNFAENYSPGNKHEWSILHPHHSREVKSVDNEIFYNFITKYV